MNHVFSVSWCQSNLVWHQNFWVFGMSIFKKLQFYTCMDNMHIKWKLKWFWICICHQKVWLGMKTFWKKLISKLFGKLRFYTYMDNMHIKWRLKSFWIHICHQKVQLGIKTFWKKMNFKIFCFDFQRKKISNTKF